jgi:hypothetical protein
MDNSEAYSRLQWALRPRWLGSLEALHGLAVDCLNTRRFDTNVPWFYLQTLCVIEQESNGNKACWNGPNARKQLQTLFDGYERSKLGHDTNWYRSCEAAVAWHAGRSNDARVIITKLGNNFQKDVFYQTFGVPYEQARKSMGNTHNL